MKQTCRFITTSAVSLILLLSIAKPLSAQLDISTGIAIRDRAVGPSLSVNYSLGSRWRVGIQGQMYQFIQTNVYSDFFGSGNNSITTKNNYLYILPTLTYSFIRREKFSIYAGISPSLRFRLTDDNINRSVWNNTYISPGLLVGAEYSLSQRWFAFAQVSGIYERRVNDVNGLSIQPSGTFGMVSFGVGYRISLRKQ
jgi:Outer membrane protein beta-barrel domain